MSFGHIKICHETEYEVEVHWEIENFLSYLNSAWKQTSPSFTWSFISWELNIKYNAANDIQLFLHKGTCDSGLPIRFKFGIRLIDGTIENRCSINKNFSSSVDDFGTLEFVQKSELVKRKYELLHARMLTISCSITQLDILTNPQNAKYEDLEVFSSNFKTLYGCIDSSDMTIIVGEQKYPVHKIILAARSDVFSAMFKHDMEEVESGIIKISDCDPTSFGVFLFYLYTGKVESLSSSNVCHLYRTADKYNVQELKRLCVRYMKRNMAVASFFDIVTFANQFEESELISITQEFFKRNALDIIKGDDWEQFLKQQFPTANQLLISMLEKIQTDD